MGETPMPTFGWTLIFDADAPLVIALEAELLQLSLTDHGVYLLL